jgi:hypothetical protein
MIPVQFKKLGQSYIWKRIFYERLSEPLHLNFISLFIALFGSLRAKIAFDLVLRHQHAYALLAAADQAKQLGYSRTTIVEFGVAAGAGLLNLQQIANRVEKLTGVGFDIYGFDSGTGMPPPQSYKDHPDLYQAGDFPMDQTALKSRLQPNTHLVIGNVAETISEVIAQGFEHRPIGFVSIDVDYYFSTVDALRILESDAKNYLPRVQVYLDDLEDMAHNSRCGELAAVHEFSDAHPLRFIERHVFLRGYRIFKNARWIDHMFQCHVLDHETRTLLVQDRKKAVLSNPYL